MKSLKFGGFSHLFQLRFLIKNLFYVIWRCREMKAQWQMRILPCMGKECALLTEVQKGVWNPWKYWRQGKVVHPEF